MAGSYVEFLSGFEITSDSAIDRRILLTKEEMKTAHADYSMPQQYFAICVDDGKFYLYNRANTLDPQLGYFRLFDEKIDLPKAIQASMTTEEGKAALEKAIATTTPGAMKEVLEDPELGEKLVQNMFNNEHFERTIDNKIDLSISVIQAIDTN